ncbi:degenerin mec-10 [Plakobranchus ocellatus]|uniref:Degenerin mec-10 n=1 Tax=Plakobranchus ocellatus TaxID=259542 RepID=A0AAV4C4X7_9GAST|nr:degenerin mec-10 [Plakobranchus ocellatus]
MAMRAGPGNGLSMEFDVQLDEYLPSTTANGLKILIHDNREMPFPEDGGIMAGMGVDTSIAIRNTQIKRLASPYADCMAKVDVNNKEELPFLQNVASLTPSTLVRSPVCRSIFTNTANVAT